VVGVGAGRQVVATCDCMVVDVVGCEGEIGVHGMGVDRVCLERWPYCPQKSIGLDAVHTKGSYT